MYRRCALMDGEAASALDKAFAAMLFQTSHRLLYSSPCRERILRLAGPQGITRLEAALEAAREAVEQESDLGTASELESASASEVEGAATQGQPAKQLLTCVVR
jgi:hypothetical protein